MQINDSILISYKIKHHFRHYTYKQKYSKYFGMNLISAHHIFNEVGQIRSI